MEDTTLASDAAGIGMSRQILLEQLATLRNLILMHEDKENADADADADADDSLDMAMKDVAKATEAVALSTEFLLTLTVLLDSWSLLLRLRLLNEGVEGHVTESVVDVAAAATAKKKQKKKRASKTKRHKQNKNKDHHKAAGEQKKRKLKPWSLVGLGGGIISLIVMIGFSFSSITMPFITVSLFHPSDGSSEGNAAPVLPPTASRSRSFRGTYKRSNNAASTSPGVIISPLPPVPVALAIVPIFSPASGTVVTNHREKSDDRALASTNPPTPKPLSSPTTTSATATPSSSLNPSNSPKATVSASPTQMPSTSSNPSPSVSTLPTISAAPASASESDISMTCVDTPGWMDKNSRGCYWYKIEYRNDPGCQGADVWEGNLGPVSENCCHCGKKVRLNEFNKYFNNNHRCIRLCSFLYILLAICSLSTSEILRT